MDNPKQSPFAIRGAIEGFYGVYYTFPERIDLIRFLGEHGFNFYMYAPKNDRQHRARWREPYPAKVMDQFGRTIAAARDAGVAFCYSVSPGVAIQYGDEQDFQALQAKLLAMFEAGGRAFSLLLDDIFPDFDTSPDRQKYRCLAEAQADLCDRTFDWLQSLDPSCTLSMCPTVYHGEAPFPPYLHTLGACLNPGIGVFYTGRKVCSPEITKQDLLSFAAAARRKPLLWDNYPVNDLGMQAEMHTGPLRGRASDLHEAASGYLANLMIQAEASKIPMATAGEYLANPQGYQPEAAWRRAIRAVAGEENEEAMLRFGENSLASCLSAGEPQPVAGLVAETMALLQVGQPVSAIQASQALEAYLVTVDEACYQLKNRMENLALRNNLLPWIELLEFWQEMGRQALLVLAGTEQGKLNQAAMNLMKVDLLAVRKHPKTIAGTVILPLAEFALQEAARIQAEAGEIGSQDIQPPGQRTALHALIS